MDFWRAPVVSLVGDLPGIVVCIGVQVGYLWEAVVMRILLRFVNSASSLSEMLVLSFYC